MSDPLIYRMGGRGTGRTTRLVKATPSGGTYVVHSSNMVPVVKGYLSQIGRDGELDVVSLNQAFNNLRGKRVPVAIDHCCFEEAYDIGRFYDEVLYAMPIVMSTDYEGDVITSFNKERA